MVHSNNTKLASLINNDNEALLNKIQWNCYFQWPAIGNYSNKPSLHKTKIVFKTELQKISARIIIKGYCVLDTIQIIKHKLKETLCINFSLKFLCRTGTSSLIHEFKCVAKQHPHIIRWHHSSIRKGSYLRNLIDMILINPDPNITSDLQVQGVEEQLPCHLPNYQCLQGQRK